VAYHQGELRRHYARLLARQLAPGRAAGERDLRHLLALEKDFYGALGLAEGMLANTAGYSAPVVGGLLERVRDLMPSDARKEHRAKYFYVRAALRLGLGERAGALGDLENAIAVWPARANPAFQALKNVRAAGGG